ncbi:uncharacterized protein RCC_12017 [Ramularia collo-cygni]|uniref:Uncharacterized protein n=1 Tax=Ramularia collo-cygni TaxID=112498 RepID=A0A2D3VB11_9PEZI|nr:uncharacterized protein RCC_12017 [Ramularia collo-cygni]CZT25263.1 uncharacterized protein RCC_12017 [Ramularia collo-cygni]
MRPDLDSLRGRVEHGIRTHDQGLRNAGKGNGAWATRIPALPDEDWALSWAGVTPPDDLGGPSTAIMYSPPPSEEETSGEDEEGEEEDEDVDGDDGVDDE